MKPGGTLHIKPNFYTEYGMTDELRPQPCRVVYIHPERRFYVVEFRSALGRPWRETFYFANRRVRHGNDTSSPILPEEQERRYENDCDHEQQRRRRKDRHRHQSG
ncbi:hypothetical protein NE612_01340 [Oscillibacter valericigenes]|nr:hypothetical protein [Oscillibacter sp.]MCQ5025482.1 hypothetical protein [Oscillibacter valericigenes]